MIRFSLRTPLIAVTSFLIGLAATLGIDRADQAGMWKETERLRAPGEMITWIFVLGDVGTEEQYRFWHIASGSVFYGCLIFCLAYMAVLVVDRMRASNT